MREVTYKPNTGKQSAPARKREDANLRLWAMHGEESVYFKREAQVNFWTVLGGLAMAALLTQLSPLLEQLRQGRWYLICSLSRPFLFLPIPGCKPAGDAWCWSGRFQ